MVLFKPQVLRLSSLAFQAMDDDKNIKMAELDNLFNEMAEEIQCSDADESGDHEGVKLNVVEESTESGSHNAEQQETIPVNYLRRPPNLHSKPKVLLADVTNPSSPYNYSWVANTEAEQIELDEDTAQTTDVYYTANTAMETEASHEEHVGDDMTALKSKIWEIINTDCEKAEGATNFTDVYEQLPKKMKKSEDVNWSMTLLGVLEVASEENLKLTSNQDLSDFKIEKDEGPQE